MWRYAFTAIRLVWVPLLAVPVYGRDLWAPWRSEADLVESPYEAQHEGVAVVGKEALWRIESGAEEEGLPLVVDAGGATLTESEGVEVTFRFRVGRVPPAGLASSHSLALFRLRGPGEERAFWLHAYSRGSSFCLNGIASDKHRPRQETLLARGAARPQGSPAWDTQWHTVRMAWCRGQLAASWDGVPVLHLVDPGIAYRELVLEWARPGDAFGWIEFGPFQVRGAVFEPR